MMLKNYLSFLFTAFMGLVVAPKLLFGSCLFSLLGLTKVFGFDPFHEIFVTFWPL